jgi:hypothetical protein
MSAAGMYWTCGLHGLTRGDCETCVDEQIAALEEDRRSAAVAAALSEAADEMRHHVRRK